MAAGSKPGSIFPAYGSRAMNAFVSSRNRVGAPPAPSPPPATFWIIAFDVQISGGDTPAASGC